MTEMKKVILNGEYTTSTEYAKAKNINNRTLRLKLKKRELPYEVVQVAGTYLIKIK